MTLTDLFRPARAPSANALAQFVAAFDARAAERRARRRMRRMLDLDDQMLDDIGVTRDEIRTATSLPISADAATELHRMSLERRRRRV